LHGAREDGLGVSSIGPIDPDVKAITKYLRWRYRARR
jgi:hypothetical protein